MRERALLRHILRYRGTDGRPCIVRDFPLYDEASERFGGDAALLGVRPLGPAPDATEAVRALAFYRQLINRDPARRTRFDKLGIDNDKMRGNPELIYVVAALVFVGPGVVPETLEVDAPVVPPRKSETAVRAEGAALMFLPDGVCKVVGDGTPRASVTFRPGSMSVGPILPRDEKWLHLPAGSRAVMVMHEEPVKVASIPMKRPEEEYTTVPMHTTRGILYTRPRAHAHKVALVGHEFGVGVVLAQICAVYADELELAYTYDGASRSDADIIMEAVLVGGGDDVKTLAKSRGRRSIIIALHPSSTPTTPSSANVDGVRTVVLRPNVSAGDAGSWSPPVTDVEWLNEYFANELGGTHVCPVGSVHTRGVATSAEVRNQLLRNSTRRTDKPRVVWAVYDSGSGSGDSTVHVAHTAGDEADVTDILNWRAGRGWLLILTDHDTKTVEGYVTTDGTRGDGRVRTEEWTNAGISVVTVLRLAEREMVTTGAAKAVVPGRSAPKARGTRRTPVVALVDPVESNVGSVLRQIGLVYQKRKEIKFTEASSYADAKRSGADFVVEFAALVPGSGTPDDDELDTVIGAEGHGDRYIVLSRRLGASVAMPDPPWTTRVYKSCNVRTLFMPAAAPEDSWYPSVGAVEGIATSIAAVVGLDGPKPLVNAFTVHYSNWPDAWVAVKRYVRDARASTAGLSGAVWTVGQPHDFVGKKGFWNVNVAGPASDLSDVGGILTGHGLSLVADDNDWLLVLTDLDADDVTRYIRDTSAGIREERVLVRPTTDIPAAIDAAVSLVKRQGAAP